MPRAPKFKPRNIPCPVPNCRKLCVSWKGLSNHLRTHPEKLRTSALRGPLHRNIPNPTPNRVNFADPITPDYDYDDDVDSMHQDIQPDAREPSLPQQTPNAAENSEKVCIHPLINGMSAILLHLHPQFYHAMIQVVLVTKLEHFCQTVLHRPPGTIHLPPTMPRMNQKKLLNLRICYFDERSFLKSKLTI